MKNYKNYVDDLKRQKTELVTALNVKGVEATNDETFNTLVPKVETISTGKPEQEKTVSITHSGSTIVTPDSGKVLSKVTAQVTDGTMTNNISVDNSGLITVNTQITGGYIATNARQATKQLTTQSAKTITPTTSDQTAVTSGKYTTGAITVKGDSNLKAENIKKDVSIFGVTGSLESGGSGDYSETWVWNENPFLNNEELNISSKISLKVSQRIYTSIRIATEIDPRNDTLYQYISCSFRNETDKYSTEIYLKDTGWESPNYRKITFLEPPTGDLLTYLQANAVKQPSDQAIQTDKTVTITKSGTTKITPDAPYDAMSKVSVNVNNITIWYDSID